MKLKDWLVKEGWTKEKLADELDYGKWYIVNVLEGKSRMCNKFKKKLTFLIGKQKFDDVSLHPIYKKKNKIKDESSIS